jgi:hypothetical protein
MSVTSQALTHAINHIESLMKQVAAETKKTIDNSSYGDRDYFVISLELTESGFQSRVGIESNDLENIAYYPNCTAIFVDQGFKFLSWEKPTENDIEAFKDMLVIKLEQAEKYDTLADRLAEQSQTRNIVITDEDLEQSTLAFLEKHNIDPDTFVEVLADNTPFDVGGLFRDANISYFKGFMEQPFKHLATPNGDRSLLLNTIFKSKGIHFSFEATEQASDEPTSDDYCVIPNIPILTLPIDDTIAWADMGSIALEGNGSETGGPAHANETLAAFLETINAMPEDRSTEPSLFAKLFINYSLSTNGIKPVFTNTATCQQTVKNHIRSTVRNLINVYDVNRMGDDKTTTIFMTKDGNFTTPLDDKEPYLLAVAIETPNGSKQCSAINLNNIMQDLIAKPNILDALAEAIEKALIDAWSQDMAQFNPVANYISECVDDGSLKAPKRQNTLEALTEDQLYFRGKAQQLKDAFKNQPWRD